MRGTADCTKLCLCVHGFQKAPSEILQKNITSYTASWLNIHDEYCLMLLNIIKEFSATTSEILFSLH
jgi:hypothetical protein